MNTINLPGFTAEHSLNGSKGQFHTVASDASYAFDAQIRPQLHCVEKNGEVACIGGGGFGLGYTDVPSGGFPSHSFDPSFAQCRARCLLTSRGAALKRCLADC
jgi:hypothetical protein